jgi:poly(beta-D-mannuronate) lyase
VGNREFFDFGMKAFDEGACAVTSDGYLPLELKRGNAALHYHVYALHPLMLLAELAQRNGHSGFEACGGGLRRLAENVLAGAENPANFEQRAGAKQKPVLGQGQDLPKTLWGWLAIYARHATLAPNWQQRLNATSRLAAAETGGDEITLYFRTRDR